LSTKIHALVDALGNPLHFLLTPGQAHDLIGADALLPQMAAEVLIANKAYDADERVLKPLANTGKSAVIPPSAKSNSAPPVRRGALSGTPPDREFLLQTQTVPRHRHALR
jgi:transposase